MTPPSRPILPQFVSILMAQFTKFLRYWRLDFSDRSHSLCLRHSCSFICVQGAGKSAVLNSLMGYPVLVILITQNSESVGES